MPDGHSGILVAILPVTVCVSDDMSPLGYGLVFGMYYSKCWTNACTLFLWPFVYVWD